MHETTYDTVKRLLKDAHYYLINTVRKEALDWQLINLLEEAIRLMETKKEILIDIRVGEKGVFCHECK